VSSGAIYQTDANWRDTVKSNDAELRRLRRRIDRLQEGGASLNQALAEVGAEIS